MKVSEFDEVEGTNEVGIGCKAVSSFFSIFNFTHEIFGVIGIAVFWTHDFVNSRSEL